MTYTVMIEIGGESVKVGRISETGFVYDSSYMSRPDATPISISLPLQEAPVGHGRKV